ncbi:hypothetical protein DPMN_155080 [Dreissena polymorpha]|uniref:Uncharacterized protein n=1 Tax=Dreissena polymorpha TaxID=45954 RepID=A0A9D4FMB9_DREPO|nr:hypothetical protein DPMN_155080 [Dreissena polymorpha]
MYGLNVNSPTVADDMILIAFSKHALDSMMKLCYDYSCKWRFEYNPSKCAVIVFNEQRCSRPEHCGFNPAELNPITLRKIYVNVVLPKALYGSPLWCNYSNSDIMQLEVSHRRCVKQILNVGRNTNTDVALSCLNIESAEELIDFEKL